MRSRFGIQVSFASQTYCWFALLFRSSQGLPARHTSLSREGQLKGIMLKGAKGVTYDRRISRWHVLCVNKARKMLRLLHTDHSCNPC